MKTLVLGLGNEILRDDGIGPAVIRELRKSGCPPGVELETTGLSGIPLLDLVTGCDTLIIVDAIKNNKKPGEISWEPVENFQTHTDAVNQHRMDLFRVLELGEQLGMEMPQTVMILAIEAQDVTSFGQFLTPEVATAVPEAAAMIKHQISVLNKENQKTSG